MADERPKKYNLKELAQSGYIMGLSTIGEVASHMDMHYDAYFSIEQFEREVAEFNLLIDGHENDSIDLYLSDDDKRALDDDLDKLMAESPTAPPEDFDVT